MDKQVEQLKQHIAELVEVRREWMGRSESRFLSEADIKEIEETAGALGGAIEALDSLKFKIEAKNKLEDLRQEYYASEAARLTDEMFAWQRRMTYMQLTGRGVCERKLELGMKTSRLSQWYKAFRKS